MAKYAYLAILITWFVVSLVAGINLFGDKRWEYIKSPKTGICYERYTTVLGLAVSASLNPIDPKYCEDK